MLIGLGYIGSEVARRAKSNGIDIIAVTKHPDRHIGLVEDSSSNSNNNYSSSITGIKKSFDYSSKYFDRNSQSR